jgi:hypothetical protein
MMPNCKECGCEIDFLFGMCDDCEAIKKAEQSYNLKLAYKALVETLDCGDGGCQYKKYGVYGIRTNGGCNCLGMKSLPSKQRIALRRLLHALKEMFED